MNSTVAKLLFWLSCFVVFWTYFGYYLFLRMYSTFVSKRVRRGSITPSVSLVIAAHNEENTIARKLENCLSLDYPKDNIEIIVVSDGSRDCTVELASPYRERGIHLIELPERVGKHGAQEAGVRSATGEIIIFTDSATILEPDAARKIVRSFSDPEVGCVSGIDRIMSSDRGAQGEGLYVEYEMMVRALESEVSSLLGVSGSFFAVRKSICETWHHDLSSDFWIPVRARIEGFRTVHEPDAVGSYCLAAQPEKEFRRKVRTVVHGLDVLFSFAAVLNPLEYGFYSFQMISHKLLRWLVPFALILCLATSMMLIGHGALYKVFFVVQVIFYIAALSAFLVEGLTNSLFFRMPLFFVMANLSILVAWFKYAGGERFVSWERTER